MRIEDQTFRISGRVEIRRWLIENPRGSLAGCDDGDRAAYASTELERLKRELDQMQRGLWNQKRGMHK